MAEQYPAASERTLGGAACGLAYSLLRSGMGSSVWQAVGDLAAGTLRTRST
jgi:hypothetical protein